jgi:hypothetical protein
LRKAWLMTAVPQSRLPSVRAPKSKLDFDILNVVENL